MMFIGAVLGAVVFAILILTVSPFWVAAVVGLGVLLAFTLVNLLAVWFKAGGGVASA